MTPNKPKELDFSNKNLDGKITSMDSLIAEKLKQRNLEIEYLQNNNYNTTIIDSENWLTPKETSAKNENINFFKKNINNNNINLTINELEQNKIKKVSFEKEETTIDVFSKLKKQTLEPINLKNSYDEQQSLTLPEVKQEHIPIYTKKDNDPILPKTEIINQLNDMNAKIDKLYEIVFKLTNLIQNNPKIQDNTTEL
jgi:hypothetical protein